MKRKTKTLLIIIIINCITNNYIHAQNKFYAGFVGGILATQVDGDNYGGYNKPGICVGGFVNRMISDKLSMQLELLYAQKGSKHNPNPENFDFTFYQMSLSYAEIPIILRYHIRPKLIAEAGLSYGRLLSSQEEDNYGILNDQPAFNTSEFAAHGGFDLPIYGKLKANFRFSYSILPIRFNSILGGYYLYGGQFNNLVYFTLRYTLNASASEN